VSGGQAAVAYRPSHTTQGTIASRPAAIRLLGDHNFAGNRPGPMRAQRGPAAHATPRTRSAPQTSHNASKVWVWLPTPTHSDDVEISTRGWKVAHPQWLVGTLVCVVALLALTPVLASGRASDKSIAWAANPASQPAAHAPEPAQPASAPAPQKETGVKSQPPARRYELLGAPTLSLAQIETVLQQYGSPAVGHGQGLYDLGLRYGINPAYALAFFVHESGCGTRGVARFTHSVGNIRWTAGYDNYEGYRSYPTWEAGIEDWYALITDLYIDGWNLKTVDEIIPVYAPYGDNNNPPGYIASVKSLVDSWRGK